MSTRILDQFRSGRRRPEREPPVDRTKQELHRQLVASLDLNKVNAMSREQLTDQLRESLTDMVRRRSLPLTAEEQGQLVGEILDEVMGFGPLEKLLRDDEISDILINGCDKVFVERRGKLSLSPVRFRDDDHLLHVIDRIVSKVGRRVDESNPMVDARLPDGSRFNAIIPPAALDGPTVSIRRFGRHPIRRNDLVRSGSVPEPMMQLLESALKAKLNVLISGGTGSGKTTLLNVMSSFIPEDERIVTIEDAAELQLQQFHVVRLETRPPNLEGQGELTTRMLLKNALRMRPDRIVIGEIRGEEAVDMLQAMNTGHEGSMSTVHANSPRHALSRLSTMVGMSLGNVTEKAVAEMISDALHLIVQVRRLTDGSRRLVSITEVMGQSQGVVTTQELFRFRQLGVTASGQVKGRYEATGVRPSFAEQLASTGHAVDASAYAFRMDV